MRIKRFNESNDDIIDIKNIMNIAVDNGYITRHPYKVFRNKDGSLMDGIGYARPVKNKFQILHTNSYNTTTMTGLVPIIDNNFIEMISEMFERMNNITDSWCNIIVRQWNGVFTKRTFREYQLDVKTYRGKKDKPYRHILGAEIIIK